MRDRLIELIRHIVIPYFAEQIADHLIANGVIVPPVRVGQTVYFALTGSDTEDRAYGEIYTGNVYSVSKDHKRVWVYCRYDNGLTYHHTAEAFGKTVFLTREDAERALKGGAE